MVNREVALPLIVLVIVAIGLITISSVAPSLLSRQVLGFVLGVVAVAIALFLGRERIYQGSVWLYGLALVLMLLTAVIGKEVNGNKNWLVLGPLQFQPLELGKIALVLMLGRYMREPLRGLRDYIPIAIIALPFVAPTLVVAGDFGGTLVLVAITFGMMLVRGVQRLHLLLMLAALVVVVPTLLWPNLKPYQQDRLTIFLNPESDPRGRGYQVLQSKIAIGSGGLTGKGYREGTQSQLGYLPEKQTDFISSVWAEEQGFVGAVFLVAMFMALFWRMAVMAGECPSETDRLVIGGVIALLGFQVIENLGAALGVLPITGLTLPLVSFGSSSLVMVMLALGLVYAVHRDRFDEL